MLRLSTKAWDLQTAPLALARPTARTHYLIVKILRDELSRIIYVFRGKEREDLKDQIFMEVAGCLEGPFRHLAKTLRDNIEFTGQYPF